MQMLHELEWVFRSFRQYKKFNTSLHFIFRLKPFSGFFTPSYSIITRLLKALWWYAVASSNVRYDSSSYFKVTLPLGGAKHIILLTKARGSEAYLIEKYDLWNLWKQGSISDNLCKPLPTQTHTSHTELVELAYLTYPPPKCGKPIKIITMFF